MGQTSTVRVWAAVVVGFSLLLRIAFIGKVELLPEEAYYWNYSQHLDLSYLDHPPMVAWLIRAGTAMFGNSEWGVRIGAFGCGLVTALYVFRMTRDLFGERAAYVSLMLTQALPFFFLSGMLMTPDSPLTAAWAAFAYYLERAILSDRARAWLGVGIALGLGLLCKYTIALAGLSAAVLLAADTEARRWIRRIAPYVAMLVALVLFTPVIVWNAHHQWASFVFQTVRRLSEHAQFSLHKLLGAALVLIGPLAVLTLVTTLFERTAAGDAWNTDRARVMRFVRYMLGVPLAVFVLFSLRHETKLDWLGAPLVIAVPAVGGAIADWSGRTVARFRRLQLAVWPAAVIVSLSLYAVGLYHLAAGIPGIGYTRHIEWAPVGWSSLGAQVNTIAQRYRSDRGKNLLVVGMDRYETASELAFYAGARSTAVDGTSAGHLFGGAGLMYEQWFPAARTAAADLLLIGWKTNDLADERLKPYVKSLEPLRSGSIERNGQFIRTYYYRIAHDYRNLSKDP